MNKPNFISDGLQTPNQDYFLLCDENDKMRDSGQNEDDLVNRLRHFENDCDSQDKIKDN